MSPALALPAPPPEIPVYRSLAGLAPGFADRLQRLLIAMRADGLNPMIAETLRSDDRQRWLYGFGREYDDGRGIVTNSEDADESWHAFGLAADVWEVTHLWRAPHAFWTALGLHAEAQGLAWGGRWHRADLPHVQFGHPMRVSPSPKAARLQAAGGNEAVWKDVGAL